MATGTTPEDRVGRSVTPARSWSRRASLVVSGLVVTGLALRIGVSLRDLDVVDRLFVPDDTYYVLSIARSLAEGSGPSVDGVHLTSGFQPLIAFLLVPVFSFTDDPDVPLRAALVLLSLADVGSALLLGRLAFRVAGRTGAVLGVALWAVSPVAMANALNGLETSLAVFAQLALVELWWRARDNGTATAFTVAGAAAGVAVLARVDSAMLVVLLGLLELVRGQRRGLVTAAGTALVVVAPWALYSTVQFGSPLPESGGAVLELVAIHRSFGLEVPEQLGWAAGSVLGTPFADIPALREHLFVHPARAVLAWGLLVGALVVAVVALTRRGREDRLPLLAVGGHAVGVLAFYSFVVSAPWFFERYLAPTRAILALVIAVATAAVWDHPRRPVVLRPVVGGAVVVLVGVSLSTSAGYLFDDPAETPDVGLHGAKGYREAARDVLALAPSGSVIGSLQSGALSYFAGEDVEVVNLDGVVDREAAEALREHRLAEFARSRGVTHLADWPFNVGTFLLHSGEPDLRPSDLMPVGTSRPQGGDSFVLLEVRWPHGPTGSDAAG